jgi:hypothetical protein
MRTAHLLAPVFAGLLALAAQDVHAADSAVTLSTVGASFETGGQYTLGFEFMVTEAVQVLTLGVFDGGTPGLAAPAQVSLWLDDAVGTLLATTEVAAGTGAALVGQFRQATISPVTLLPGTHYVVGAYLPAGEATSFNMGDGGSSGSFDARLTAVVDRYWSDFSVGGNGQDFPLDSSFVDGGAWLGASFQLSAVPEPTSAGLLVAGLLGMALRRRRATTTAAPPG